MSLLELCLTVGVAFSLGYAIATRRKVSQLEQRFNEHHRQLAKFDKWHVAQHTTITEGMNWLNDDLGELEEDVEHFEQLESLLKEIAWKNN
jgi:hypothetical protein